MDKLKKIFKDNLHRGKPLSFRELLAISKAKKLGLTTRQVRNIRKQFVETLVFTSARLKPKEFMTVAIHKLGLLQWDVGFFEKEIAKLNRKYKGFLLSVCVATGLMMPVLVVQNKVGTYQFALKKIVDSRLFPAIHTIQTDKERAFVSPELTEYALEEFGIRFHQMVTGSKAFAAERAIRTIKTKVSQVQLSRKTDKWINIILDVANHHNEQNAFGTSFRRIDIDDENFLQYMSERYGKKDVTLTYPGSKISYAYLKWAGMAEKLMKFKVGEKVAVTILADKTVKRKYKTFIKKSRHGTYYPKVYKIVKAALRKTYSGQLVAGNLRVRRKKKLIKVDFYAKRRCFSFSVPTGERTWWSTRLRLVLHGRLNFSRECFA